MKQYLLYIFLLCCFYVNVKADNVKIHAIVFCNTDDEKIGKSCQSDQERFVNELGIIETALKCEVDWLNVYTGRECNKPNLESVVSELRCNPNDVIFFYYSGHGVHAAADPVDGWLPQMCLNYQSYDQDKFVPVTYVRDKLVSKGVRLCLILTDCCNNDADWVTVKGLVNSEEKAPSTVGIDVEKLKKLFYESRGTVIATSSKRGEVSYGPDSGGCFSVAFWDEMYRIEQGSGSADWGALLEATKKRTLQYTNNEQEPVYKVDIDGLNPNPQPNPQPNPSPVIIAVGEKELGEAFKQIVNPSISRAERLNMVNAIVQKLFDTDAQVFMVGRNLTTKIGAPMNITKYLEELALSKTVKGVNVVRANKSNSGKFNNLIVSEIR